MAKELKDQAISLRLTPTAARVWDKLAERWGQSRAAVLERLLREAAKAEGVPIEATNPSTHERQEAAV